MVYLLQEFMARSVSKNIREFRQKKGISQDHLSKDADVTLNTIVKIETGKIRIPHTLKKIAQALDVSVNDLLK